MKRVVSVSLGSSAGDHGVMTGMLEQLFDVSRIGTNGNFKSAQQMIRDLDGHVDAIGLGGADIYLRCRDKRYGLRDGLRLAECAKRTPIVDGSGLKDTLERLIAKLLISDSSLPIAGEEVLFVSALDRFGIAEEFVNAGCKPTFGDKIFCLDLDQPMYSINELEVQAEKLLPDLAKMPISMLYPIWQKQDESLPCVFPQYIARTKWIVGDKHIIKRKTGNDLVGKIVLTNTLTQADIEMFRNRGVTTLISTTPEYNGRSFGTNVLEAMMVAYLEKPVDAITPDDYRNLIGLMGLKPRIIQLK